MTQINNLFGLQFYCHKKTLYLALNHHDEKIWLFINNEKWFTYLHHVWLSEIIKDRPYNAFSVLHEMVFDANWNWSN